MQRIVLTGATSMLGLALIKRATEQNIEVLAIVNPDSKRKDRIPKDDRVSVVECGLDGLKDLNLEASVDAPAGEGDDVFYHLAWASTSRAGRQDVRGHIDNISYTIDAGELASRLGCKRFIGTGSQAEYGRHDGPLRADTLCRPEVPYGAAKLCAGDMSRIRCAQLNMEHIWTRILSAYGPYDSENTIIPLEIKALLAGEHFGCTAGEQFWELIYSEDVADALLLLGDKGIDGKVYPIGTGDARPLRDFLEIVKNEIDPTATLGYGERAYGPGQVMHLEADISELKKDTGFEPKVEFKEGVRRTVEYFRNRD